VGRWDGSWKENKVQVGGKGIKKRYLEEESNEAKVYMAWGLIVRERR
jgi:hypothetical protein